MIFCTDIWTGQSTGDGLWPSQSPPGKQVEFTDSPALQTSTQSSSHCCCPRGRKQHPSTGCLRGCPQIQQLQRSLARSRRPWPKGHRSTDLRSEKHDCPLPWCFLQVPFKTGPCYVCRPNCTQHLPQIRVLFRVVSVEISRETFTSPKKKKKISFPLEPSYSYGLS